MEGLLVIYFGMPLGLMLNQGGLGHGHQKDKKEVWRVKEAFFLEDFIMGS